MSRGKQLNLVSATLPHVCFADLPSPLVTLQFFSLVAVSPRQIDMNVKFQIDEQHHHHIPYLQSCNGKR